MNKILEEVAAERKRQIEVKGLACAAAYYALTAAASQADDDDMKRVAYYAAEMLWPFDVKANPKDARGDLIRSMALGLAEIERLDRASDAASS